MRAPGSARRAPVAPNGRSRTPFHSSGSPLRAGPHAGDPNAVIDSDYFASATARPIREQK
jgi:hypothetical protein